MAPWKKTLYAAWLGQFLSIVGFAFVLPFLPYYIERLGVSDPTDLRRWSGIVIAAAPITLAIFSPLWGALSDRYGRKMMMLRSMLGGAVVLWLMAYAQTVQQLVLLRLLQGALTGTMAASIVLVATVAPREHSGYALGMMQAAVFVGNSLGPLMGGFIADRFGYQTSFIIAGGLLALGAGVVRFAVHDTAPLLKRGAETHERRYGHILAASGFLVATMVLFGVRFANSASGPVFPLLVKEVRGTEAHIGTVTGAIYAMAGLAAAVSAGTFGRLGDRFGHKRMLIGLCGFCALVALCFLAATHISHLFVLRTLFGFGAAGMMASATVVVRRSAHDGSIGKAYGLTHGLSALGMTVGPLAGGFLAAQWGLRSPFVLIALFLAGLVMLVAYCVRPDVRADSQADSA